MLEEKSEKKEGGYGWVIVFASFMIHFIMYGVQYGYGVYLARYLDHEFQGASRTTLALVGSTGISLIATLGIATGWLADRFGYRNMAVLGSCIFASGYVLASFATEVWQLVLSQGVIVGIGSSLAFVPAVSIVSQWFDRRRGFATGICVAGSGIGGLFFSLVSQVLIEKLGVRWALRITALVSLVVGVGCGLLLKERVVPSRRRVDLGLFRQAKFFILFIGGFISSLGIMVPFFVMPLYVNSFGMSSSQGALLVGILNGGNAIGRVLLGLAADKVGRINVMLFGISVMGILPVVAWIPATTFPTMVVFCVLYGLVAGAYLSLISVTSAYLFGLQNIASTNGLLYMSVGIPCFLGTPIATALLDSSTSFLPVILFTSISGLIGACFIAYLKFLVFRNPLAKC
ncbi:hypothetical protein DSO57_1037301 [Entomophthora muscae]|uniref:Uncharacterized protein n=1 Tax=Entomophthora muscae TaxID=34485 RepID=A0ACC2TKR4_9FUNG|nr:hypothetical protein DSO57_1037301 [Entomophthora muscae]